MKLGLKLWSTNDFYIEEATRLYNEKVYDYIELFVVPNSINYLNLWSDLKIPFMLHAPHSYAGFNPSVPKFKIQNLKLLEQVEEYRKILNPEYIIFHPGISGKIINTIRQFNIFKEMFPTLFSLSLIENKPAVGIQGEKCLGCSVDDIIKIKKETGMGFCYDIGHSICYANSTGKNWKKVFFEFLNLCPSLFHLSDGHINSDKDQHLNYGHGNFELKWIIQSISNNSIILIETDKQTKNNLKCFTSDSEKLKELL